MPRQAKLVQHKTLIIYFSALMLLSSLAAFIINTRFYAYTGCIYVSIDFIYISCVTFAMYLGCVLHFGRNKIPTLILREFFFFTMVINILMLGVNSAQWTPFLPIDLYLIRWERLVKIDTPELLNWTAHHTTIKQILCFCYDSLAVQLFILPFLIILTQRFYLLREHYALLFISGLIGFTFYYFFPTTAPASVFNSPYFTADQHSTGLKFIEIHQHIPPSTNQGGMIAMPSFHVIWAWLSQYLLREWSLAFYTLLPINLCLVIACVMLGWHYGVDILSSVIVLVISHWICAQGIQPRQWTMSRIIKWATSKRSKSGSENHTSIQ